MSRPLGGARDQVDQVRADARAALGIVPSPVRFDMTIRYAREMGWLQVRDPFTGQWHEVRAQDVPPSWRTAAFVEKRRRRDAEDRAREAAF